MHNLLEGICYLSTRKDCCRIRYRVLAPGSGHYSNRYISMLQWVSIKNWLLNQKEQVWVLQKVSRM